jgi:hypothetical protein
MNLTLEKTWKNALAKEFERDYFNQLMSFVNFEYSKFPDQVAYFPAYEIMLDELRDYRYYQADMIHPTDLAVNYIYERFKQAHFTDNLLVISKRWQEIYNTLQHRPHPLQFPEHREIIERLRKEIEADQSGVDSSKLMTKIDQQILALS